METNPPPFDPHPQSDPNRNFEEGRKYKLDELDSWPFAYHRFSRESVWAIRSAIAARRPLLLRGEPGIGKSQLARAAARVLGVPFLCHVINERSERDELLYTYDAVARLALAQIGQAAFKDPDELRTKLSEVNFICPGPLWWAYNWSEAEKQAHLFKAHCRGCFVPAKPKHWIPEASSNPCGPVVLIDEMDKADPSVPNGLLESLGNEGFSTPQLGQSVRLPTGAKTPLIIITTNEERELPAAFLRRCLVLQMNFPDENQSDAVAEFLIRDRARVWWTGEEISDAICREAIDQLLRDRAEARDQVLPVPGAAEFLDLLRVLLTFKGEDAQRAALREIHRFVFRKNLEVKR
jgi:MoxR-like ATPase